MKSLLVFLSLFVSLTAFAQVKDSTKQIGIASYYAKKFEGRKTSSGERYRASKFTAAHRTLPFGTMVRVKNIRTGKTVTVRINDRGPFSKKFSLDISGAAAKALGIYRLGYAKVEVAYAR